MTWYGTMSEATQKKLQKYVIQEDLSNLSVPLEVVITDISHEDGWTNDSGTSWPEETIIHYYYYYNNKNGKRTRRSNQKCYVYDMIELMNYLVEG